MATQGASSKLHFNSLMVENDNHQEVNVANGATMLIQIIIVATSQKMIRLFTKIDP